MLAAIRVAPGLVGAAAISGEWSSTVPAGWRTRPDGNATMETYHADGVESVRAVTCPNGNIVQTYGTDEFGIPGGSI
jgi:hypothetical protein